MARDITAVLEQREEAQRKLTDAQAQLAHDERMTLRPLRQMVRENHVSEHLDSLMRKVREYGDPGSASP